MALSFPSSPSVNDTYSAGSKTWKWNGYAWDLLPGGGILTFDSAPPASGNTVGDRWIDISDGTEYLWFSDGSSYQWADFSTPTINVYSIIGGTAGQIPYQQGSTNTAFVPAGTNGQLLSINSLTPQWVSQTTLSIANTQITGVITSAQLANTTVTPGTYGGGAIPVITVDQQGRLTYAGNASSNLSLSGTSGTGTVSIGGTLTFAGSNGFNAIVSGSTVTISDAQDLRTSANPQFNSLGVGTAGSGTTGEIRATNNVTAYYSDKRLKENIKRIENALQKLLSLSGVTFNANKVAEQYGYTDKKEQVGVIAQEVEAVLPQVVVPAPFDIGQNEDGTEYSKSGENYKTVQYEKIIPLLIEAIKEQQLQIEELKGMINGN